MDLKSFHREWELMSADEKSFTKQNLDSQRLRSATTLRNLHQQILPIEAELRRLSDAYDKEHKNYQQIDRKLAVADGRHELCKPVKGSNYKPKQSVEKTLDQIILGMSPGQLEEFIAKHAKKGELR
jgi:hypothetical protein